MTPIAYLKLQAKNLYRDYKTKKPYVDDVDGHTYYEYAPQFFDIDGLFLAYDWDEEDFSLMKAQHLISLMAGFNKWSDLVNASEVEQEIGRLLLKNQDKVELIEWQMYIRNSERENDMTFDNELKLDILKNVFITDEHPSLYQNYLIKK